MAPPSALFDLNGLSIRVRSDTPRVAHTIHETLRYKGTKTLTVSKAEPDLALDFSLSRVVTSLPAAAQRLGPTEHGNIWVWKTGNRMFLTHGEHTVVALDPADGTARGALDPALGEPSEQRRNPLFYLITFSLLILLRYRGRFALHAAALAREGRGVLLIADSDSGKSTAALNLVRQGWSYLSDDTVLLQAEGASVRASSFRKDFCIDPEAVELSPELAGHDWPPSPSDTSKWRVDLSTLYPGQFVEQCIPRVLILPEIVDAPESSLGPMNPTIMLGHLAHQSALLLTPDPQIAGQHFELLKRLIDQSGLYRLRAGRNVLVNPAKIDRLLTPLLPETSMAQGA